MNNVLEWVLVYLWIIPLLKIGRPFTRNPLRRIPWLLANRACDWWDAQQNETAPAVAE